MTRRERISAVDTAWLRMDRPDNLMMICGVMLFREPLRRARLRKTLEERFLRFERFRQRPGTHDGDALWTRDRHFDLDRHLVVARLPEPGGKAELETFVSALAGTPLDARHPLWQFHLVPRYGNGSALVVRLHHCYADGIALIQVMLAMTDSGRRGPPAMAVSPRPSRRRAPEGDEHADWLPRPMGSAIRMAARIGGLLIEKGAAIWQDPVQAMTLAQQGTALTTEIARLALMTPDTDTRFKRPLSGRKLVAWADTLPLYEVKVIGRALGASVNDVLLSCAAGALGRYLEQNGEPTAGVVIRALVPVNLRPPARAGELGNEFGLVFLELPVGLANPVERLYAVRNNMRALKDSWQPVLALGLLAAMGAGPRVLQDQILEALARNASAVMTNVPGPRDPLFLAGARIDSLMFWVPQSGNIGVGASIISFDGAVQFGLITDHALCPDPKRIAAAFADEFERLVLATLLSPWPWEGQLDPAVAAVAAAG